MRKKTTKICFIISTNIPSVSPKVPMDHLMYSLIWHNYHQICGPQILVGNRNPKQEEEMFSAEKNGALREHLITFYLASEAAWTEANKKSYEWSPSTFRISKSLLGSYDCWSLSKSLLAKGGTHSGQVDNLSQDHTLKQIHMHT